MAKKPKRSAKSAENLKAKLNEINVRAKKDREYWSRLESLCEQNDTVGFYRLYAEYLEWSGIHSRGRLLLHHMAMVSSGRIEA